MNEPNISYNPISLSLIKCPNCGIEVAKTQMSIRKHLSKHIQNKQITEEEKNNFLKRNGLWNN